MRTVSDKNERTCISIHSPHTRGDELAAEIAAYTEKFQSTPLMRGETVQTAFGVNYIEFQSTPLTRGETMPLSTIPRETHLFQSTPLTRGETATLMFNSF